jgi:phosphopantothenoylcysteine decarboxylase / phosphopantothenate---cysteine ligase
LGRGEDCGKDPEDGGVNASSSLRFLITAGPTREFLDPIRFISNRSSGKMGYALAEAACAVSTHVVLVSGPTTLSSPKGVEFVGVTTAQEMADAVFARFEQCDVMIMAAAVCDFRPKAPAKSKIKKQTFAGTLEVVTTIDILAELGKRKQSRVLVGFAAETGDLEGNATEKLNRKQLDLIVANDASAFDAETNRVTLFGAAGEKEQLPEMSKRAVAAAIIERVLKLSR